MSGPLKPEDVLRLQFIRDARLAPDRRLVSYALWRTSEAGQGDRSQLHVLDLDSGADRCISDDAFASHPRWSPDGQQLLYVTSRPGGDALFIVDVRSGRAQSVDVPAEAIRGAPAWSPDGKLIAVVLETRLRETAEVRRTTSRLFRAEAIGFTGDRVQRLALIHIAERRISTLADGLGYYSQLEWDDAGERILFLATASPVPGAGLSPALYSIHVASRIIRSYVDADWFISTARWAPGGRRIVIVGAYGSPATVPTTDLWVIDCDSGAVSCRSSAVKGRVGIRLHHDMPIWDAGWNDGVVVKDGQSAWVTVQNGGAAEIWELSLAGPERSERILHGERACIAVDACRERRRLLFLTTDVLQPPNLHVYDGASARQVTWINREVMAEWPQLSCRQLRFASSDGLALEGWFLAEACHSQPLPTVMFVHGGPFMAAGHAFRFDLHLLASRGFGVLMANFRGSFGYGEPFARSIVGDWGARGFPDHMAAVDHAIEQGLAHPDRLGVWGASHGGFATCWIVGHTDRFRAAVAEAAVTNLTTAYYLSDAPDYFSRDLGGKPHEIPDVYRSRSPITFAHRCKTPTLLIHGEQDLRCPIAEAEQFYRVLLDAGCTSEMVRLRDANHLGDSIGPPAARVGQNAALIGWFERFV